MAGESSLTDRAQALRQSASALGDLPILTRAARAQELVSEAAAIIAELAARIDQLEGGGDGTHQ